MIKAKLLIFGIWQTPLFKTTGYFMAFYDSIYVPVGKIPGLTYLSHNFFVYCRSTNN
jgi:hypothetical protein